MRLPNVPGWEETLDAIAPWRDVPSAPGPNVQQGLADAVGLPTLMLNDADLGALGEHRFGAGRGTTDMLYVTCSTGVGAGVIIGGRLLHGRRSLAELGWTTIERSEDDWSANVEELASGTALARLAGVDGATATARARAGDPHALAAFERVAEALAVGVVNGIFCFMPERVVVGGGVAQGAGDLLLDPVRRRVAAEGPKLAIMPDVVQAARGDDVTLLGGYALWSDVAEGPRPWIGLTPSIPRAQPA